MSNCTCNTYCISNGSAPSLTMKFWCKVEEWNTTQVEVPTTANVDNLKDRTLGQWGMDWLMEGGVNESGGRGRVSTGK
jgi:hypothetical protein